MVKKREFIFIFGNAQKATSFDRPHRDEHGGTIVSHFGRILTKLQPFLFITAVILTGSAARALVYFWTAPVSMFMVGIHQIIHHNSCFAEFYGTKTLFDGLDLCSDLE